MEHIEYKEMDHQILELCRPPMSQNIQSYRVNSHGMRVSEIPLAYGFSERLLNDRYVSSACIDMFEIICPVFIDHWVVISKSVLPTTAGALKLRFSRTGLRPQLGLCHRKEFWGKDKHDSCLWTHLLVETGGWIDPCFGSKTECQFNQSNFCFPFFIWKIGRSWRVDRRPSNLNLWAALPWLALAWCKEKHSPKDFQTVAFV